ncbi:ParA family protein [Microvirga brassicacearum]|uniref:ParA family protein n=1 Tax=Microvirga brassicacearum TaxID=2580413 RepID=A0A5N3P397_9HYPH|nr:ParA family protein [Microvirga brassicacearum]KAB0264197.1 ParA family protein [Microvirga brassicacearum]
MEPIVLISSKGGAARTSSSALLAAGAREIGLRPLIVQLLPKGRPPALDGVEDLPFDADLIFYDDFSAAADRIRFHAQNQPTNCPVIVDTPAKPVRSTLAMLAFVQAKLLIPIRDGVAEIERAARDYCDIWDEFCLSLERGQDGVLPTHSVRFLPVGWSPNIQIEDFAAMLSRRGVAFDGMRPLPIVQGIPNLDPMSLLMTGRGERFQLTPREREAAKNLARSVLSHIAFG